MEQKELSAFSVAAVYIGTVVGAGFATGQEILQFFVNFGAYGCLGLALSTFLFFFFGARILVHGRRLRAASHRDIILFASGKRIGTALDVIITFFLFGSFASMIAGTGALGSQLWGLPEAAGGILMAVFTAAVVWRGLEGVVFSIRFVAPILLVSVTVVSLCTITVRPPVISAVIPTAADNPLMSNFLLASILYVSYNTVLSVAVLAPLGAAAISGNVLKKGALLGGIGLGAAAALIFLALCSDYSAFSSPEVPMLTAARRISPLVQAIYALVLTAEIFTTSVGSLFGFSARLKQAGFPEKPVISAACVLAFLASRFGFSGLVAYLYPVVGYVGFLLLLGLLLRGAQVPRRTSM